MKSLLLILLFTSLFSKSEFNIENDFLEGLEEVSEIATKTKLNIDDSPSFVSVLESEKLKKLGINNVFEALAQVPGVQLKRENSGVPVVVFRGVSQKGEVKLMIDGVTINNSYRGSIYYFLDFPIELIRRIEVIRGAGSVLYGSGAISGVVNIITKSTSDQNQNTIFASAGTNDRYRGGMLFSTNIEDIKIAIDAYYKDSSKIINKTDRNSRDYSVGLNIKDKYFSFLARVKKYKAGNAYGVFGVADVDKHKYNNINETIFTQLSYNYLLGNKSDIELLFGYSQYKQNVETKHPIVGVLNAKYNENSYYTQADLKSSMIPNNEFLLGVKFEHSKILDSELKKGIVQLLAVANPNLKRDTLSVYLNDKYTIDSDLDISFGLRCDNYSDFGDTISPTISFVYRMSPKLRIKALYANAFRAPSWIELTSNSNLKEEKSETYELGFIYKKNASNTLRLNMYRTSLDDMITKELTYIQNSNGLFQGVELEYIYAPLAKLEVDLLASYIDAKDSDGDDIADVANVLLNASVLYEFNSGLSASTLLKYVSSSKRTSTDYRKDMPSSTIFDATLSYSFKDIMVSLVIKDIFNNGAYYALPKSSNNNDFYDGGTSVFVKAEWEF